MQETNLENDLTQLSPPLQLIDPLLVLNLLPSEDASYLIDCFCQKKIAIQIITSNPIKPKLAISPLAPKLEEKLNQICVTQKKYLIDISDGILALEATDYLDGILSTGQFTLYVFENITFVMENNRCTNQ